MTDTGRKSFAEWEEKHKQTPVLRQLHLVFEISDHYSCPVTAFSRDRVSNAVYDTLVNRLRNANKTSALLHLRIT
jgi:hypothetical protein